MALSNMVSGVAGSGSLHRFTVPPLMQLLLSLLLAVSTVGQLASSVPEVCLIPNNTVTLNTSGTVFLRTNVETLRVVMRIPVCSSFFASNVNLSEIVARNLTSGEYQVGPWYELNFINGEEQIVKIGSQVIERLTKKTTGCRKSGMDFFFDRSTVLGRSCKEINNTLPSAQRAHPTPFSNYPNYSKMSFGELQDFYGKYFKERFDNDQLSLERPFGKNDDQNFGNWHDLPDVPFGQSIFTLPTFPPPITVDSNSYDTGYNYRNEREESVIPIFIGVIAFVVSMCIRFCLCRRKRVVTTVTVIRSIPSPDIEASDTPARHQEHLDLPPAYADILNETISAQDCPPDSYMDLPPAYDDIREEAAPPPPYSEIESQALPRSEAAPPAQLSNIVEEGSLAREETAGGEGSTAPAEPPVVPAPPSPDAPSSSSLARVLTSQFRSLRTQFAFKPLQEE